MTPRRRQRFWSRRTEAQEVNEHAKTMFALYRLIEEMKLDIEEQMEEKKKSEKKPDDKPKAQVLNAAQTVLLTMFVNMIMGLIIFSAVTTYLK